MWSLQNLPEGFSFRSFDMKLIYVVPKTIPLNFVLQICDKLRDYEDMGLQTLPCGSLNTIPRICCFQTD
jgi:hypothetical protein